MARFPGYLLPILLLLALSAPPALAETYFIYDDYGDTWQDANKTAANTEDDFMCWAAAASNILAWGNWGTADYNTADQIFQHIQDHWTDSGGIMSWAWQWWFNGTRRPISYGSYTNVPGGGNFYPDLDFSDYYTLATEDNVLSGIDTLLHQGIGVCLGIRQSEGASSHAVTCWGYSSDTVGYTSLHLTDSDDGYLGLQEYPVSLLDGFWYLRGSYSGWRIKRVEGLGPLSSNDPSPLLGYPLGRGFFPCFC